MYKLIILIISSSGEIYDILKNKQIEYLKLFTNIKFFFVEFKDNDCIIDNNIYIKGVESINPGMIIKTCKAIDWINNNYDYDFLLRTNLSTFLNLNAIFKFIECLPKDNIYAGFSFSGFVTGTGIFMAKPTTQILIDNYQNFNINNIHEDVLISQCMHKFNVPYYNPIHTFKWGLILNHRDVYISENFIYYFTDNGFEEFEIDENILHYRINNTPNRNLDHQCFDYLLKKIYNITL